MADSSSSAAGLAAGLACGMRKEQTAQQKVTAEWDGMAGEWDDMAGGYAKAFYRMLSTKTDMIAKDDNNDDSASSSSSSLVIVDFGCGTGLLTERLQPKASKIVAFDAAPKMIEMLQEKIRGRAWNNVTAHAVVLADIIINEEESGGGDSSSSSAEIKTLLDSLEGSVDLIVASSVLTFIPEADMPPTMRILGKLLKPGSGLLVHSDWPKSEAKHPDAMTEEKAQQIYAMAGSSGDGGGGDGGDASASLEAVSMEIEPFSMGSHGTADVFVGVARKPA